MWVWLCLCVAVNAHRKLIPKKAARQNNICLNKNSGDLVAHPTECHLFYLCHGDEPVKASCPNTMMFNSVSKMCDVASKVQCPVTPTDPSVTTASPSFTIPVQPDFDERDRRNAMEYCASLPPQTQLNRITYIGSTINCQNYFVCYYGQALGQECSSNLHWNAKIGKCDLPANAKCRLDNQSWQGGSVVNAGGSSSSSELINCPVYGEHIFPHMKKCELFIFCVKGHAVLQQCPFYHHFDVVSKSCKWRTKALCVRDLNLKANIRDDLILPINKL